MDLGSMAIGVGVGLALAASGWTATKIAQWAEAKIASIEASTFHTQTVTAALAASTPAAAPAAAPVAPAAS